MRCFVALAVVIHAMPAWSVTLCRGDIIAAHYRTSEIFRIDPVSGAIDVITTGGELIEPSALVLDSNWHLLVVDSVRQVVVRVNPADGSQVVLFSTHELGGIFPVGIALEHDGDIVVANTQTVVRFDRDTFSPTLISDGGLFHHLWGIAVDPQTGDLIVADATAHSTGGSLARFELPGDNIHRRIVRGVSARNRNRARHTPRGLETENTGVLVPAWRSDGEEKSAADGRG